MENGIEMKVKLAVFGLLGACFYLIFDWSATNQVMIKMNDNLSLKSFYVFVSLLSFIIFMYFYIKFLWIFFNFIKKTIIKLVRSTRNGRSKKIKS